jgi:PAS domain S-box-containing protein
MDREQFHAVLDHAPSAFVSTDAVGTITYWNRRAEEMFGLAREEAVGRSIVDTVLPERYGEGVERYVRTGQGSLVGTRVELSARAPGGGEFPVEVSIWRTEEDGAVEYHVFLLDISERREREQERQRRLSELEGALRGSEERLAVILDAIGEAVTIRGIDGELTYANSAALARMGLATVQELRETGTDALFGQYIVSGEDGREITREELPSMRLLRGEPAEPLLMRTVNRTSGDESWVLLKATPIRGRDREVEATVTIIEDVTGERNAALRSEFLARAGQQLASSLDYGQTLRNVASLAVPQIADWCGVDLFDDQGCRETVAVAHVDPAKLEMASALRAYDPEELDPEQGLGLVRATGEPAVYNEIPDELLVQAAVDEEHLRLLREVGMRAVLIVPLTARGRTIGALTLVNAESGRTFGPDDVEFAQQIAARAALAVDNARLHRASVQVARTLQDSLLPEALPEVPGWEVAALYRPAGHESDVGGDFYDLWPVGEDWMVMIGDVTGKGVDAAVVTSLVRHTAWTASDFASRPAEILGHVDRALKRRPSIPVCTALCMRVRGASGTLACGGHPPPLHLHAQGVAEIGRYGTLLGGFASVSWPETTFTMQPGETLVAITDGVTDAIGPGEERFGNERLHELLWENRGESPAVIRQRLMAALDGFQEGPQADDTAVVILRYVGVGADRGRERAGQPVGAGEQA